MYVYVCELMNESFLSAFFHVSRRSRPIQSPSNPLLGSHLDLGSHKGILAGPRGLLHRGRSAVSRNRLVVQVENYRQEYLSTSNAVLVDRRAAGHR